MTHSNANSFIPRINSNVLILKTTKNDEEMIPLLKSKVTPKWLIWEKNCVQLLFVGLMEQIAPGGVCIKNRKIWIIFHKPWRIRYFQNIVSGQRQSECISSYAKAKVAFWMVQSESKKFAHIERLSRNSIYRPPYVCRAIVSEREIKNRILDKDSHQLEDQFYSVSCSHSFTALQWCNE